MYLNASPPSELTPEERDRAHLAQTVAKIVVLHGPGIRSRHPLSREPDAVAFPEKGLVTLLWPDVTYTFDEDDKKVTETLRDPFTGELSSRVFGSPDPAVDEDE
jgi:hypothetical protein